MSVEAAGKGIDGVAVAGMCSRRLCRAEWVWCSEWATSHPHLLPPHNRALGIGVCSNSGGMGSP